MAVLESAAILLVAVLACVVLAGVFYRMAGVDPLATFAGGMTAAFLVVVGYVVAGGVGAIELQYGLDTLLSPTLGFVLLASLALVRRMDPSDAAWTAALRERFLLGVPWGTLIAMALVMAVYLFLQNGLEHWGDPVTVSFRAWSFQYPLGVVTSGFAHNGPSHLLGNLFGTLVLGSVAEYAWGHVPTNRGESSFGSAVTNPWIRALVLFPAAIVVAGLLMGVLSMGPVIGFSGVVFALMGFALVRYPIATVAATVAQDAVWELYLALTNPIFISRPAPAPPSPPFWARIAIQIHALGLLVGIAVGAYVFWKRNRSPDPLRLWTGVALIGMAKGLWALYWFRGHNEYVLFRGPGLVVVALFALMVTAALVASKRPIRAPSPDPRGTTTASGAEPNPSAGQGTGTTDDEETVSADGGASDDPPDDRFWRRDLSYRSVAILMLVLSIGIVGGFGAASNAFTIASADAPNDAVEARDFRVYYAEDVTNERVAIVNGSFYNETTRVRSSGVIVTSPRRGIWITAVQKDRLAFSGAERVRVGGVGWDRSVIATRQGWSAAGGSSAYKVYLRPEDGEQRLAYASQPAEASPTIRGRNVSVLPTPRGFALLVTENGSTVESVPVPDGGGEAVRADELTFVRHGDDVFAVANGTRVKVASRETYN
jgi:membrane associated rhomboid family serine protease